MAELQEMLAVELSRQCVVFYAHMDFLGKKSK